MDALKGRSAVTPTSMRQRPSHAVAMCLYNGSRYLGEQLDSIARQTELPAHMVVLDDGSSDGSLDIVRRWANSVPFPVTALKNAQQLGVVRNFELASSRITQDVIFLADQDDVWYPDKVRTFIDVFAADTSVALVHSDADLIDGDGAPMGRRLFDTLLVTAQERDAVASGQAWKAYAKRNLVTGAACAFRRDLLAHATPFSALWMHDEWLAFVASLVSRVRLLDEPTMAYRLHGGNAVGMPLPTLGWRLRTTLDAFMLPTQPRQSLRAQRLDEICDLARKLGAPPEAMEHLQLAAAHARFRGNLPRNPVKRFLGVAREHRAGHYHEWSNVPASVLHDLLVAR